MTGKTPAQLIGPAFNEAGETVWEAWREVQDDRQPGFNGPGALTHTAIKDYIELAGIRLERWEVKALKRIDRAYRDAISR